MKKKVLAGLLAGIVLTISILPTASFAQEDLGMERTQAQGTSQENKGPVPKDLAQLRLFVNGKEYFLKYPFRRGEKEYWIILPAGTKEVTIQAVPVDARAKIWLGAGEDAKEIQGDYVYRLKGTNSSKEKGYKNKFTDLANIYVSKDKPDGQEKKYIITLDVAGSPDPVITGAKSHYVFKRFKKVTREDLLKGVKAYDEGKEDITSEITVGEAKNWKDGQFGT